MRKFVSGKIKTITIIAVAICALTSKSEEVYKEDFSSFELKRANAQRKIVEIKNEPGIKQALRLETITGKDDKPHYCSWSSPIFDSGAADIVYVDYWMKPDKSARYALFVKDKSGKQLVAVIIDNGYFKSNSMGQWAKAAPVKYEKWQHVRYKINLLLASYDFYVDDMKKPITSGIKYRYSDCGSPAGLWTESSESGPSVSYFANISVKTETSSVFPPSQLSVFPFFVAGIRKTQEAPALDGKGDSAPWKKAQALHFDNERNIKEKSFVKLLWDDKNLYVLFSAQAKDMAKRKNAQTDHDAKIWMDDCFEIFIDPKLSKKDYCHIVGNSAGGLYDAFLKKDLAQKDVSWDSGIKVSLSNEENHWTAEMAISFEVLGTLPKAGDVWGMNAGRENPFTGEVTSWRPLKSFHCPEMFGKILFTDSEYEKMPRAEQIKNLGDLLYNADGLLKEASKNLKAAQTDEMNQGYFKKTANVFEKKIAKCRDDLIKTKNFMDFYVNARKAEKLVESSKKFLIDAERLKRFFSPGSEGAKRKYVACVESSMNKVPYQGHMGTSAAKADLQLAGREWGSFQTVILTEPGKPLKGVSIKITELKDREGKVLEGAKINSFLVDYITTAKSSSQQEEIADPLLPGKEFKLKTPMEVIPLWFDAYLPANAKPGKYSATISITPDGLETTKIPVNLKALPFNLPLKASLPTAFCFVDKWVEGYYGKKIPREKRYEYMQFILDHRLEPMNLWLGKQNLFMNEEELEWAEKRGKGLLFLPVTKAINSKAYYQKTIDKFKGRLEPVFFGHDEVLGSKNPEALGRMKSDYKKIKEMFPEVPRMNTSAIDERLYGYVDIWCPLFNHFESKDAESRKNKGEKVWWYPTDYPSKPFANFNLDSPGIDPRIIPWMNWKLDITGLLYWALNREWLTNYQEAQKLTEKEKRARGLNWMTKETQEKIKKGLRWPEVPWIPYFRSVTNKNASPSTTNGGGNMMYPGPDFQPISSIRLKNLRDGMQDYEYFVILKNNIEKLKKLGSDNKLAEKAEKALNLNEVLEGATAYTKNPEVLNHKKIELAELIVETQDELKKTRSAK